MTTQDLTKFVLCVRAVDENEQLRHQFEIEMAKLQKKKEREAKFQNLQDRLKVGFLMNNKEKDKEKDKDNGKESKESKSNVPKENGKVINKPYQHRGVKSVDSEHMPPIPSYSSNSPTSSAASSPSSSSSSSQRAPSPLNILSGPNHNNEQQHTNTHSHHQPQQTHHQPTSKNSSNSSPPLSPKHEKAMEKHMEECLRVSSDQLIARVQDLQYFIDSVLLLTAFSVAV